MGDLFIEFNVAGHAKMCGRSCQNVWQVMPKCVAGHAKMRGRSCQNVWQFMPKCVAGHAKMRGRSCQNVWQNGVGMDKRNLTFQATDRGPIS